MDVLAKGLLAVGAIALLAATLAGLVIALRYMYESLEPFGTKTRIGACIGVGLFGLALPGTAIAGLSSGEAMLVIGSIALLTLGLLTARGAHVRRQMRGSESD